MGWAAGRAAAAGWAADCSREQAGATSRATHCACRAAAAASWVQFAAARIAMTFTKRRDWPHPGGLGGGGGDGGGRGGRGGGGGFGGGGGGGGGLQGRVSTYQPLAMWKTVQAHDDFLCTCIKYNPK